MRGLAQVTELRGEIGLEIAPAAVSGRSRDYICFTSATRRSRWGSLRPSRLSRTFWALSPGRLEPASCGRVRTGQWLWFSYTSFRRKSSAVCSDRVGQRW